ncbi:MAG: nucleoside monophosphate kinase [Patescibacteria group bacterium]
MINNHAIVVIGPPGSGKSTLAEVAREKGYHIVTVSEALDKIASEEEKAKMQLGLLAPDHLAHAAIMEATPAPHEASKLFFDGAARTKEQARMLIQMLFNQYQYIVTLIHYTVDREVAEARMRRRNRPDDKPKIIKTRLDTYDDNFVATYLYLKRYCNNSSYTIDGNPSPDIVEYAFLQKLQEEYQKFALQEKRVANGQLQEA